MSPRRPQTSASRIWLPSSSVWIRPEAWPSEGRRRAVVVASDQRMWICLADHQLSAFSSSVLERVAELVVGLRRFGKLGSLAVPRGGDSMVSEPGSRSADAGPHRHLAVGEGERA